MNREHLAKRNEERYNGELSSSHAVLTQLEKDAIVIGYKRSHTFICIAPHKDFYVFCYVNRRSGKVKTFLPVTEERLKRARAYFDKEYEQRKAEFSKKNLASKMARLNKEFRKYHGRLERTERFL